MSLVVWLTGLPASGKTTLAERVAPRLGATVIDAEFVRDAFWPEIGWSEEDRCKNIERLIALVGLLQRSRVNVVVAAITPFESMRQEARGRLGPSYLEVYVVCSLETRVRRDPKGLYANGPPGFPGPYEKPMTPDLVVHTDQEGIEESVAKILVALEASVV